MEKDRLINGTRVTDSMEDAESDQTPVGDGQRKKSTLYGVLGGICIVCSDIMTKQASEEIDIMLFMFFRSSLMLILLSVLILCKKSTIYIKKEHRIYTFMSAIGFSLQIFTMFLAITLLNIFIPAIFEKLKIAMGMACLRIIYKIPILCWDVFVVIVVVSGVAVVCYFSFTNVAQLHITPLAYLEGIICSIVMVIMACVTGLVNKKLQNVEILPIMFWQTIMSILISGGVAIAVWPKVTWSLPIAVLIPLSTITATGYMFLMNRAQQFGNMGFAFLGESINVIGTFLGQYVCFNIMPNPYCCVGTIIVLMGVVLSTFRDDVVQRYSKIANSFAI